MAAPDAIAVTRALDQVLRQDRGRLLAALIARLRDFQLAEDALQDAAASAVVHWVRTGLPEKPVGWLLRVALRKAFDRLRGSSREARRMAEMALIAGEEGYEDMPEAIPDERLRLIFTCCHPALDQKSRVALTLRTLGGLATVQIARTFLDTEPTMAQRLSRAKAKIAAARIPFVVPDPPDWPERLNSVLAVIYLIFTAGHARPGGPDLCGEAIHLARMLDRLRPGEAETEGALALLLFTHARRAARVGADGASVPPEAQDRALWDEGMRAEAQLILDRAVARRSPGPYQIKAAISALHAEEGPTDWPQIALLYEALMRWEPTPVIGLNRAVALAQAGLLERAAQQMAALESDLAEYQPFHAARADLLARQGRLAEARAAYDRAIAGTESPSDAAFLRQRRAALEG